MVICFAKLKQMTNKPTISVVIPTRNRLDSLNRTLVSISNQTCFPKEIIIVDSSDITLSKEQLVLDTENLIIINSIPSVCLQRNIGIQKSSSDYIFLCDDDIEISENYIDELVTYLEASATENITSGLLLEKKGEGWTYGDEKKSILSLVISFIFGLSLGFDMNNKDYPNNFFIQKIVNSYIKKGNNISKSGWPNIINYKGDVFKTSIYGLGASIIRACELKKVSFDTSFYKNGIGDNYDLAIGLNSSIAVIKKAKAYHHRENTNRLDNNLAYYYRVAALHYILLKHKRFNYKNILFLLWSLFGNSILFLKQGEFKRVYYNLLLIFRIIFNKNLYKQQLL